MCKKIVVMFLALVAAFCLAFGLTACGDEKVSEGNNTQQNGGLTEEPTEEPDKEDEEPDEDPDEEPNEEPTENPDENPIETPDETVTGKMTEEQWVSAWEATVGADSVTINILSELTTDENFCATIIEKIDVPNNTSFICISNDKVGDGGYLYFKDDFDTLSRTEYRLYLYPDTPYWEIGKYVYETEEDYHNATSIEGILLFLLWGRGVDLGDGVDMADLGFCGAMAELYDTFDYDEETNIYSATLYSNIYSEIIEHEIQLLFEDGRLSALRQAARESIVTYTFSDYNATEVIIPDEALQAENASSIS